MASDLTVQIIRGPGSGANANKILIPAGQTLDASAASLIPANAQVVQIKNVNSTSAPSANGSSTFTNSGVYVDIVPKFANSKILVIAQSHIWRSGAGHNWHRIINQTTGAVSGNRGGRDQYSGYHEDVTIVWQDSPGSTASQRYEIQFADRDNNSSIGLYFNDGGSYQSGMTVMEIKE